MVDCPVGLEVGSKLYIVLPECWLGKVKEIKIPATVFRKETWLVLHQRILAGQALAANAGCPNRASPACPLAKAEINRIYPNPRQRIKGLAATMVLDCSPTFIYLGFDCGSYAKLDEKKLDTICTLQSKPRENYLKQHKLK